MTSLIKVYLSVTLCKTARTSLYCSLGIMSGIVQIILHNLTLVFSVRLSAIKQSHKTVHIYLQRVICYGLILSDSDETQNH